ncbi:MAG: FAD-dependent oxidoreductase [Rubripirellula sp.]
MKIAVSGCGIAGTAVAALLARQGHSVTIFEQANECRPIGAGIMLQPSGQAVLARMGLSEVVEQKSARLDGLDASLASGKSLIQLRYDALGDSTCAWGVHRGLLFESLLGECTANGVEICNGSALQSCRRVDDRVSVVDQEEREYGGFDFVLATDGARSKLRTASALRCRLIDYPYAALWATGPCPQVERCLHQVIDGTRRLVGLLPIGNGQCSFFWGVRSDHYDDLVSTGIGKWKNEVIRLCPPAAELLETVERFDELTFSGYRHVGMRSWNTDSVLFLGDAAHASSPHLGQGANLALEDAEVFANALAETGDFDSACKWFTKQRYRKIRYYQQLTRLLTPFFQSDIPLLSFGRNAVLPWFPAVPFIRRRMLRTLCGLHDGWWK